MNWSAALATVKKVQVLTTDEHGRIASANVPGSTATYRVRLVRQDNQNLIWCQCDRCDGQECPGNKSTVCFHCLATVLAGCEGKVRVEWYNTLAEAEDRRQGRRLVTLKSSQSEKAIFGIVLDNR
jgi:hypothetical protein